MRVLGNALLFVVALAVLLAGAGMLLPRVVTAERAVVIGAPPATVFALVNGYRLFNRWSPWFAEDPGARYTYEGPDSGVGARMAWASDKEDVGSGSQEIVESRPHELVRTRLDFGGEGTATARFVLAPEGEGTRLAWDFETDMGAGPIGRWFGLMVARMVGRDFDQGLEALKAFAEGLPKEDFAGLVVEEVEVGPALVAFVPATSARDAQAIGAAIGAAYGQVGRFMATNGLRQAGAPITITHRWDESGCAFDAAIPIDRAPAKEPPADAPVRIKTTYAGRALKVVHRGPYGGLEATHKRLAAWMAAHGYDASGPPWDEYVSDPGSTAEADLVTHLFMPVK